MVLFCEVFEQYHVVLFIGVVDKYRLGAHTQHLTHREVTTELRKSESTVYNLIQWYVFYLPQGSPPAPAG